MVHKSAFDEDVDHVLVPTKVDLLKCKCYNAKLERAAIKFYLAQSDHVCLSVYFGRHES